MPSLFEPPTYVEACSCVPSALSLAMKMSEPLRNFIEVESVVLGPPLNVVS